MLFRYYVITLLRYYSLCCLQYTKKRPRHKVPAAYVSQLYLSLLATSSARR